MPREQGFNARPHETTGKVITEVEESGNVRAVWVTNKRQEPHDLCSRPITASRQLLRSYITHVSSALWPWILASGAVDRIRLTGFIIRTQD